MFTETNQKLESVKIEVPEDVDGLAWNVLRREAKKRGIGNYKKTRKDLERELKEQVRSNSIENKTEEEVEELNKGGKVTSKVKKYCPSCKYNSEYIPSKNRKVTYGIKKDATCAKYEKKEDCVLIQKKAGVYNK